MLVAICFYRCFSGKNNACTSPVSHPPTRKTKKILTGIRMLREEGSTELIQFGASPHLHCLSVKTLCTRHGSFCKSEVFPLLLMLSFCSFPHSGVHFRTKGVHPHTRKQNSLSEKTSTKWMAFYRSSRLFVHLNLLKYILTFQTSPKTANSTVWTFKS